MNTFQFSPGLTQLRDWAREKAEDTDVPEDERQLWERIADEIDSFHAFAMPAEPPAEDLFGGPR